MENKSILTRLLCLMLVALVSTSSNAQVFNPPSSYEDTYPSGGTQISRTTHTSCYSFSGINFFGSGQDLVVSAWDEPSLYATVAWRRLVPGSPSSIISQGLIPYGPGYRDMEVGFIEVAGTIKIFVAYYKMGSGHYLDIYDLMLGGPVLVGNVTLSSSTTYGRISLDCHKLYAMSVIWEDNAFLKTRVAWNTGSSVGISPEITLDPYIKRYQPDVTFSHANSTGALLCEYVYEEVGANRQLTQSSFDFWTMAGFGSPTTIGPSIQDIDVIGFNTFVSPPNIDCPDHYTVQNWAYTYYTNTSNDIYVRMIDYNSTAVPQTIIVNDGSLGNFPINGSYNVNPFLSYSRNYDDFYVGWFTDEIDPTTGTFAGYVSVDVHESGTFLMSAPDYLSVANVPTDASGTPFLSSSKYTEASDYLYTIFPQYNTSTGYEMQHKYHDWSSLASYKGDGDHNHTADCNDEGRIAFLAKGTANAFSKANAYPNPFTNKVTVSVSANMQNEEMDVTITNITGAVVFRSTGIPSDINKQLNNLNSLNAGIYMMNINCKAVGYSNTIKLQKAD